MKTLILLLLCFSLQAQDTTIVIPFDNIYITDGYAYTGAELSVSVHKPLYDISYELTAPDTIGGFAVTRYNTVMSFRDLTASAAIAVLNYINGQLNTKREVLQGRYISMNAQTLRLFDQHSDVNKIKDGFLELKTWAQAQ